MEVMVDRHQALRNVLGSAHLEGADPSPEVVAAMRAWADDPTSTPEQLGEMAKRAAAGLPLSDRQRRQAELDAPAATPDDRCVLIGTGRPATPDELRAFIAREQDRIRSERGLSPAA